MQISVKCAARELADGTARLGPRLLTNTVVGPPNKHRRSRWRGVGEWESFLTQSLPDQSTSARNHNACNVADLEDAKSLEVTVSNKRDVNQLGCCLVW